MPVIDYWYEFASTYSYPATITIADRAAAAGIALRWRPILLGAIFRDLELPPDSPFNRQPVKGANMWRDMERICARAGLPLVRPDPFPQSSLHAARVATVGLDEGWTPGFSRRVYRAEFGDGATIGDPQVLESILDGMGLDAARILDESGSEETKERLRAHTDQARAAGIFGAPSLTTEDGELFWGQDRIDMALEWANGIGRIPA